MYPLLQQAFEGRQLAFGCPWFDEIKRRPIEADDQYLRLMCTL
jgi:hypothetical protein